MSAEADGDDRRECEERLRFETLLADLSARFINPPADRVDAEIEDAQRRVCECLALDLSALWQRDADTPDSLVLSHYHRRLDGPPVPVRMQASEHFPWALREMTAGRNILISSLDNVPEGAERDLEAWRHFGLKNVAAFPLSVGRETFGAVSFHDMVTPRTWSEALIKRLQLVAAILANAIARKCAERALRESETRYRGIFEGSTEGMFRTSLQGKCIMANSALARMLGYGSADEFVREIEDTAQQVWTNPEERARHVRRVREQGCVLAHECEFRRKDGTTIWVSLSTRAVRGPDGEVAHFDGFVEDITVRRKAEEALRESAARMAAALDAAELGFYEVRDGNRVSFVDRRACDIIGASEADERTGLIFELWQERLHSEDRPRVMELNEALNEGRRNRLTTDYRFLHPERGVIHIHHLVHVIDRDAAGHAVWTIGVLQDVTERKRAEESLHQALDEVQSLRDRLQNENVYLREQMRSESGHGAIVGESEPVQKMLAMARKVAPTDSAVLITGETGVGKELLAQAIHDMSPRKAKTMVKVNCAALPAPLVESELFGREKGAYTGAMTQQVGRFEVADGSTIFLDEIGDLPLDLQGKLLRVLQDGSFERLGSHRTLHTNVRVVAATNRDLAAMIGEGKFREDLFHRLNVFPIEVPPLRAREVDIPMLVWKFVREFNLKMGRSIDAIPKSSMEHLKQHPWPGNVRELRNVIERAMIVSEGRSLKIEIPSGSMPPSSAPSTLEDVERHHILDILERTHWRIRGKGGAAEALGLVATTLHSRMKKLGIARPKA